MARIRRIQLGSQRMLWGLTFFFIGLTAFTAPRSAQRPATWRLVEEWRVGGAPEGPHSFTDVRGMSVRRDGSIVVLDAKDRQLHWLDARGRPVRSVGRPGGGPGEYRTSTGLATAPSGEITVNDPVAGRMSILSPTGDFVRSVMVPVSSFKVYWDGQYDAAGRLFELVDVYGANSRDYTTTVRVWVAGLTRADTLPPVHCANAAAPGPDGTRFRVQFADGPTSVHIPFSEPRVPSARASDGSEWTGRHPDYAVIERRAPGTCDVIASIRLRGPQVAVPREERDKAVDGMRAFLSGRGAQMPDFGRIPREFPFYDALFVDESDNVWVERTTATDKRRFDIHAATGALIAEAELPVPLPRYRPVVITRDRVYVFTLDEDDVAYLVAFRIVR